MQHQSQGKRLSVLNLAIANLPPVGDWLLPWKVNRALSMHYAGNESYPLSKYACRPATSPARNGKLLVRRAIPANAEVTSGEGMIVVVRFVRRRELLYTLPERLL